MFPKYGKIFCFPNMGLIMVTKCYRKYFRGQWLYSIVVAIIESIVSK
nr:MAG TPA: hypothetical protein [Caudoviricetes sp.]